MIDLKNFFLMPSFHDGMKANGVVYGRESHHLEGMNITNNTKVYAYHNDTGKAMIFSKAPQKDSSGKLTQCWPMDVKEYDSNFIYDSYTELDWSSPKNFKKHNPRYVMCPRFWDGDPTRYTFATHATYDVYQNCAVTGHGDVGPIYYTLLRPFVMDFGGDVGQATTIILSYYWSDKKHREQLFLTDRAGWVKWTHAVLKQLSPGIAEYVIDAEVNHNMIVPGVLTPLFPCATL